jgi:sodium transport system ATP-binding protein
LSNVHKSISGVRILDGVNLHLRQGKVTALLGPNGAGKTSTIRVILGLLEPQRGQVKVLGIPVKENKREIRKKVGLLPQADAGYKSLSGRENLEFLINLAGKTMGDVEEELQALITRLDLNEIIDQDFGTLSGGERRAIGFIRAILSGSQFLILDEPTTGLDLARAAILRRIIQEQVKQGKTILMSSHVLTDLEELADDIIIMKNGVVIKSGTRAEIQEYFAPGKELEDAIVNAFMGKNMHLEDF